MSGYLDILTYVYLSCYLLFHFSQLQKCIRNFLYSIFGILYILLCHIFCLSRYLVFSLSRYMGFHLFHFLLFLFYSYTTIRYFRFSIIWLYFSQLQKCIRNFIYLLFGILYILLCHIFCLSRYLVFCLSRYLIFCLSRYLIFCLSRYLVFAYPAILDFTFSIFLYFLFYS